MSQFERTNTVKCLADGGDKNVIYGKTVSNLWNWGSVDRTISGVMGHGIGAGSDHSCEKSASRIARAWRERVSEVVEVDREWRISRTVGPPGGTATKAVSYVHLLFPPTHPFLSKVEDGETYR